MAFPLLPIIGALASGLLPVIPNLLGAFKTKNKWAKLAFDVLGKFFNLPKDATQADLEAALAKVSADEKIGLKALDVEFARLVNEDKQALYELEGHIASLQGDLNKTDAKSKDKFRSWWRPFVAWVCALGLSISGLIIPASIFGMGVAALFGYIPAYGQDALAIWKQVDITVALGVIIPMLGLGGYRTLEKLRKKLD